MQIVYETTVHDIGPLACELKDQQMIILFGANAPDDLAEYCFLIDVNQVDGDIQSGDVLLINDNEYKITAVGGAVQKNLSTLGHITIKFNGSESGTVSGTLYVESSEVEEIKSGSTIKIIKK